MGLHGGVAKAVSGLGFNPDCCTDVAAVNMLAMLRACMLILPVTPSCIMLFRICVRQGTV